MVLLTIARSTKPKRPAVGRKHQQKISAKSRIQTKRDCEFFVEVDDGLERPYRRRIGQNVQLTTTYLDRVAATKEDDTNRPRIK